MLSAHPDAHCKHRVSIVGPGVLAKKHEVVTFHHCERYRGSPLKASNLHLRQMGRSRDIGNMVNFDPRPKHLVRQEIFNNQCIGYQAMYGASSVGLAMHTLYCKLYHWQIFMQ